MKARDFPGPHGSRRRFAPPHHEAGRSWLVVGFVSARSILPSRRNSEVRMPIIKVLSAGAVQSMVEALGREFERNSGNKVDLTFNTAGSLRDRVKNGEAADVVILSESIIAGLDKLGLFVPGSIVNLGRTVTGVAIREGAPAPDISTPAAFKQALLNAKTVSYTDPKAGGSGGIMFTAMLEKLGIADAIAKKAVLGQRGAEVAQLIADGKAELGTTFISEVCR